MLQDDCAVILTLAGSLVSAGQGLIVHDLIRKGLVDVVVATGANIVDQDFFEALGHRHYQGDPKADDEALRQLWIDRIYDTYIDEEELRHTDYTIAEIADGLEPRPYSSREFIWHMGRYLVERGLGEKSIVRAAYEEGVPIFVPAFSDSSAGFGLVYHQVKNPKAHVTIDSVADFRELTEIKLKAKTTGLVMLGGGVPKNFAQDIVVAAEVLGHRVEMHKYAIQITVADERDGGFPAPPFRRRKAGARWTQASPRWSSPRRPSPSPSSPPTSGTGPPRGPSDATPTSSGGRCPLRPWVPPGGWLYHPPFFWYTPGKCPMS